MPGDKIQPTHAPMPSPYHIYDVLSSEGPFMGTSLARLILAAVLGGAIGLEREFKHRPAGLRTNLFICVGAAMFTLLSDQLAVKYIGDHTRIAAQIIPGIGFIGAGSILHSRGDLVTGITSAATLFVVASIGMAVGGGLYLTSIFATILILLCLYLLGMAEQKFSIKMGFNTYEVIGSNEADMTAEINRLLECIHSIPQNIQVAPTREHIRVQFDVEGTSREQRQFLRALRASSLLETATPLGPVQAE
jgi:putative Mg2+ transporter-C (MgtC) family protein